MDFSVIFKYILTFVKKGIKIIKFFWHTVVNQIVITENNNTRIQAINLYQV